MKYSCKGRKEGSLCNRHRGAWSPIVDRPLYYTSFLFLKIVPEESLRSYTANEINSWEKIDWCNHFCANGQTKWRKKTSFWLYLWKNGQLLQLVVRSCVIVPWQMFFQNSSDATSNSNAGHRVCSRVRIVSDVILRTFRNKYSEQALECAFSASAGGLTT